MSLMTGANESRRRNREKRQSLKSIKARRGGESCSAAASRRKAAVMRDIT